MSKSKGNFYTVRDLINPGPDAEHVPEPIRQHGGVNPLALRYALLQGQYRKPFNFTLDTLQTASRHVRRFQEASEHVNEALEADADGDDALGDKLDDVYDRTLEAMCDDLNTPAATAAALKGVKAIEKTESLSGPAARSARNWLDRTNALLGIVESEHAPASEERSEAAGLPSNQLADSIEELLDEREAARTDGEYARADAIRDTLEALGIEVMDTPDGTEWRRKATL